MNGLVVAGGEVLLPQGWSISDVFIRKGRIVPGAANVGYDGETVDGAGGTIEKRRTGGAGAERAAFLAVTVEGDTVPAARSEPLAAGGDAGARAERARGGAGGVEILDARGLRVVPGFVDLQCNGGYGIDLSTEPERLWELAAVLPRTGVTAWLPTVVTGPAEVRSRALAALRAGPPSPAPAGAADATSLAPTAEPGSGPRVGAVACADGAGTGSGAAAVARAGTGTWAGAVPLGLHLEGPLLSPERPGAHPEAFLRQPGAADLGLDGWSPEAGVALVTLAPELPGALEVIRDLNERGVVVSAGHSSAAAAEATAAVEAGVRWVTHLFNTMAPLHHREPGLAGIALTDDRVRVGVVADGLHLHPAAVTLASRALGDRLTLVTDATAALGLPPGPVRLGEREAVVDDTGVRLADGTLAGSDLSLDRAVRNLGAFAGVGLADAVRAASSVPAAVLGLPDRGAIVPGAVGDLVLLDAAGTVVATVVAGRVAYDRRAEPG